MNRLADRAPGLDIFSSKFVLLDDSGWRTDTGRQFLASLGIQDIRIRLVGRDAWVEPG
jgi:hypothetical protein